MNPTKGWAVVDANGKVRLVCMSRADARWEARGLYLRTGSEFIVQRVGVREAGR